MASQGPNFPSTATAVASGDANEVTWTNPGNVGADDGTQAEVTAATFDSPDPTFYLYARGFGFTIPAGSTIDGIVVEIDRRSITAGGGIDRELRLSDANGALIGDSKHDAVTVWPQPSTIKTYGGTTDTWNTGLSAANLLAMVNDPDFGVYFQAQANIANADIGVDFIRITVHYTETAVPPTPGGGIAGGAAPTALTSPASSGAAAAGSTPSPQALVTASGAAGAGVAPAAIALVAIGGATAGGVAPTESSGVFETPTFGGASAGGVEPKAIASGIHGALWPPPLLDSFTGTDGDIDGRVAGDRIWESPGISGSAAAQIGTNRFAGSAGANRSAALVGEQGEGQQAAATIVGTPTSNNVYIYLRAGSGGTLPLASLSGHYRAVPIIGAGASDDELRITRNIGGSDVVVLNATGTGFDWADGDAFGMSLVEEGGATMVRAYRKPSGGSWGLIGSFADTTGSRPMDGFAIIRLQFTAVSLDDLLFAFTTQAASAFGTSPNPSASVPAGGAAALGTSPNPSAPVPAGGAAALGTSPSVRVGVTPGGATAGGVAPTEGAVTETPVPGGGIAGGTSPTARVAVSPGGALAGGTAPSSPLIETPTPGGAIAGGAGPAATATSGQGGTTASSFTVSPTITITSGGAVSGGNAPSAPMLETPIFGGAIAGGAGPASAAVANQGGSLASDFIATAGVTISLGGATTGGLEPSAPLTEIPIPGVAIAGGFPPLEIGLTRYGSALGGDRSRAGVRGGDFARGGARGGDRARQYATGGDRRS
ncbi:MAG: putative Ig protein [Gaiellaceae bacterium]|jgi:hypothetical protein|nr:putative Ig protein [Gaiellaceae bacterium]